jgi:hypothetical protein
MYYKNDVLKKKIFKEYPAIRFFVETECSRCDCDCTIPSTEAFFCLINKVNDAGGEHPIEQHTSQSIQLDDQPRKNVRANKSKKKRYMKQSENQSEMRMEVFG